MTIKESLSANMVLHWDFRKGTIKDQTSNGYDGTFGTGTEYWTNTKRGKGVHMNDTNDEGVYNIGCSAGVNATAGTVSGWFNTGILKTSAYVFSIGGDDFSMYLTNAAADLKIYHDNVDSLTWTHNFSQDENVHFVATYATSGDIKLFINGVKVETDSAQATDMDPTDGFCSGNVISGADPGNFAWFGAMMEAIVWNIEFTDAQATQLYSEALKEANLNKIPTKTSLPEGDYTDSNIVGAWDMSVSGNVVSDLSASGNNGAFSGDVTVTKGMQGSALRFVDGKLTMGHISEFEFGTNDFSLSFWVKPEAQGATNVILGQGGVGASGGFTVYRSGALNTIYWLCETTAPVGYEARTNESMVLNEWNHVVCVRDASESDGLKVYFNGTEATYALQADASGQSITNAANNFIIGNEADGITRPFIGTIDSVKVWNKVLSPTEIVSEYEKSKDKLNYYADGKDWNVSTGNVTSGYLENTGWQRNTGTWQVNNSTGANKQITNVADGELYIKSTQAYGQWEFDWYKKDASALLVHFISDEVTNLGAGTENGYTIWMTTTEEYTFRKVTAGGLTALFTTAASQYSADTWYRMKITRTNAGLFSLYNKLASAPDSDYALINAAVTETTHTTSVYFFVEIDANDAVRNFRFSPVID